MGVEYLLRYFNMLRRPLSMGGWLPVPLTEIAALEQLLDIRLKRHELDGLLRLDAVWITVMQEIGHPFQDED